MDSQRTDSTAADSTGAEPRPPELARVVTDLDHIAIVVPSIEAARPLYEGALGMRAGEVEHIASQKVNVLCLDAGPQRIELVEPAAADSPVSKFIEQRGGGLHHVAYRVADCAAAIERLTAAGLRMINDTPQPGAHGTRVAFIHPKSTGGVLTELVEVPSAGREHDGH